MARNVHIWCGYTPVEGFDPPEYLAGFRVHIPEAFTDMYSDNKTDFDQTLQCGDKLFKTAEEATKFAQVNANAYLNLLAVFGVIEMSDIERTFWEWISTN